MSEWKKQRSLSHLCAGTACSIGSEAYSSCGNLEPTSQPVYVHYGCGCRAPAGWINFDASPRLRLERVPILRNLIQQKVGYLFPPNVRYGDIIQGLPVRSSTAAGVYCSHVLEHLPRDTISTALQHTFRMLMPGGRFRLVVPDLFWRAQEYLKAAEGGDPEAADTFLDRCLIGTKVKNRSLVASVRHRYGLSRHHWMYDCAGLKVLLEEVGFCNVRRCHLGDSGDAMFDLVEERDRFFEGEQPELAIEALKPQ